MGKFISLKYDFTFKALFSNETIRRHFISDVLVELNDSTRINVELQIKGLSYWTQRSLFYLAKMYTDEHGAGEKYRKLKKCICISVLGLTWTMGQNTTRSTDCGMKKDMNFLIRWRCIS